MARLNMHSYVQALLAYQRLCTIVDPQDPQSWSSAGANRTSGLAILRAGLAYAPTLVRVLHVVAAQGPLTRDEVSQALGETCSYDGLGNHLWRLHQDGFVERTRASPPSSLGGTSPYRYTLSDLGRRVMEGWEVRR